MRIVRNIGHVKRRKRAAKWTALLGFVVLAGALALGFVPELFWLAYLLLFLGFVLFNVGMQQVGKWNRGPRYRNDSLLDQKLAPFSDRTHALIHYPKLGDKVVEHLVVHPGGVLVITARELAGTVMARGNRWRRGGNPLRRAFSLSGPQLGNPSHETRKSIEIVENYLAEHGLEVDVEGAIVFVNQRVELDAEDPDFPALRLEELWDFVRDLPPDRSIGTADHQRLVALLSVGQELETTARTRTRRPVKKKAA
jgi:hypothetical protein